MKSRYVVLAVFGLSLQVTTSYGASFDCRKAITPVEKLICSETELKVLDIKLHEMYMRSQRLSANPNGVRADQRFWLKNTRNKCKTKECLSGTYQERIAILNAGIRYKECMGSNDGEMTTLDQSYCEAKRRDEAEKSIGDLVNILSDRYDPQSMDQFTRFQGEWRKNLDCGCREKIGYGTGPGIARLLNECEKEGMEYRLSEIREIVAGLRNIEHSGVSLKSCQQIRSENEAKPENQIVRAIAKNDIDNVKRLLKEGNPMPRGDYSHTPIDIAARNNNVEMLSFLLRNGANPDQDIVAMRAALKTCNMKMVSLLVDHGYKVKGNPSFYGPYDPLPWAAFYGCTSIVDELVSKGADITSTKLLRHAVMDCHVETVKYLLKNGHDPDSTDMGERTPLWFAAIKAVNYPDKRSACKTIISDLLRAGANPDRAFIVPTENPGLKLARDDEEIMKLLRSKANKN